MSGDLNYLVTIALCVYIGDLHRTLGDNGRASLWFLLAAAWACLWVTT